MASPSQAPERRSLIQMLLCASQSLFADLREPDDGAGLSARAPSGQATAARVLLLTDRTGSFQLAELSADTLTMLTALPEPVGLARYRPGHEQAVLEIDRGGNELHGLYLIDLPHLEDPSRPPVASFDQLEPLATDPRFAHHFAGVSPDGSLIAFTSNERTGVHFDVHLLDLDSGERSLLYAPDAWCHPASGFSPDGRLLSILRPGADPLDDELVLIELASGIAHPVCAHPEEPALVGSPKWGMDGNAYVPSSVGSEFQRILRLSPPDGKPEPLAEVGQDADADLVAAAAAPILVTIENHDGASFLTVRSSGAAPRPLALPEPGVVLSHSFPPPRLTADGSALHLTLSTPRLPAQAHRIDIPTGSVTRLTDPQPAIPVERLAAAEPQTLTSFDGESLPVFIYRPREAGANPPVVVLVHGGPESQSVRSFNPVVQGLVASGIGVVVPNVRGSTGYGKRFASLDDRRLRLDSVADLGSLNSQLAELGFDRHRAGLWGGSYGGYMVLAGLAFQPELWAAGVDIVGISNLVTFLENTSDYRRAHREREYGSLAEDRDFLARASPLGQAHRIMAPLFVIHGRNDPRVPLSEAQQLISSLADRGIRTILRVYDDEGHGLARLANRLDAYPAAIDFLIEVLRP